VSAIASSALISYGRGAPGKTALHLRTTIRITDLDRARDFLCNKPRAMTARAERGTAWPPARV